MRVQGTSLAWADHDPATAKHPGQREPASNRSRSWIKTSTPWEDQGFCLRLGSGNAADRLLGCCTSFGLIGVRLQELLQATGPKAVMPLTIQPLLVCWTA